MSIECVTGEYHHMKVVEVSGEGRGILIKVECATCRATKKDYIDADEGKWTKKVESIRFYEENQEKI